jgi:hypothetical protein
LAKIRKSPNQALEARTVGAHRAYVDALAAWERTVHLAMCPACRPAGMSAQDHDRRCENAEAEKERRRIIFRDLCDELSFVPSGHGIAMPAAPRVWCQQGRSC